MYKYISLRALEILERVPVVEKLDIAKKKYRVIYNTIEYVHVPRYRNLVLRFLFRNKKIGKFKLEQSLRKNKFVLELSTKKEKKNHSTAVFSKSVQ